MINNKQTISVIIPAYNEELKLSQCLESLLNQTHPVDEIIVISNGSNDSTAKIARSFKNVKVIEIKKRSLIHARNIGFDKASGDILARINADVVCMPNWSERLRYNFNNKDVFAVSGVAKTWTMVFMPKFFTTFWSRVYLNYIESFFGIPILWGSNMALRKEAWLKINNLNCLEDSEVHEDQDLSIHLNFTGARISKDTKFIVINTEESYFDWSKLKYYIKVCYKTKNSHRHELSQAQFRIGFIKRVINFSVTIIPAVTFIFASSVMALINWLWHYLFCKHRSQ